MSDNFTPDNSNLLKNIKAFQNNQKQETFMAVFNELQGENAFLIVPTAEPVMGENKDENGWSTIEKGRQMTFTSVFEVEGQKVLGAFTSQQTLMIWAQETKPFVSIPAKDVLDIAMQNDISKIIIDSNQDTMFVLGRSI
ncbi:SseB family protein [Flavobacterium jejuense]|uniref:SseB family protein n=1 Tax=Flavobacterium jejuense TaxID=1544455 RepID=A0ABX0ISU7_9FLAO|nr:SseB family protein [Flavobacterium jejuense]NHN24939.1 SseB family protein [Flavobacterium jejuense]